MFLRVYRHQKQNNVKLGFTSTIVATLLAGSAMCAFIPPLPLRPRFVLRTLLRRKAIPTRPSKFAAEVRRSKGSVVVKIFPNGQLGDEGPIADGVGAGAIDIGLGGSIDAIDPRLNTFVSSHFSSKDAANVL